MPTRKQRRRRQKGRRHEYEYVYVDDEGREVEADPAELESEKSPPSRSRRGRATTARSVPPPSWSRVGKRGLIFAPLMFLTVTLLYRDLAPVSRVVFTLQLLLMFLPFSYVIDRMAYRRYLKQTGQLDARASRKP